MLNRTGKNTIKRVLGLKTIALCVLLLFIAMMAVPAWADNLEDTREQKKEVEQQIEEERADMDSRRTREEQLKIELNNLDQQLREIRSELDDLNLNISLTENNIYDTEIELLEAELRLDYQESLLMTRLRVIYERGTVNYIEVLLESASFSDFLTRFYNLRTIAENDLLLVGEVEEERVAIALNKEGLEQKRTELIGMRRQVVTKKEQIDRTKASRSAVLAELQEEIKRNHQAIKDLEKDAAELAKEIEKILAQRARDRENNNGNNGGTRPEGRLVWPVEAPNYISSPYGNRSDPFTGGSAFHGGIDIATYGRHKKIYAGESGVVVFARYSGGYGNYIMIDHGGGLMTLYAHMHAMHVSGGQKVSRGQTIGLAGTTGRSTGIHLHFEVWDNNNRVNPMNFL